MDRFKAWINSTPGSIRRVPAVVAPFVLFFVLRHRDRIAARKPAVQIDIGTAFRAERLEPLIGGFATGGAGFADLEVGHSKIGAMTRIWALTAAPPSSHRVEPAEMDRKTLAAEQRHGLVERQADDVGIGAD